MKRIQAQVALTYGWPDFEVNTEKEAIVFRDAWRLLAGGPADPFLAEFVSKWPRRFARLQPLIEQHRALGKLLLAADAELISILKGISDADLEDLNDESDPD